MTAPVASLLMTPPDMGGQGVAPAVAATAGSDSGFDALVSAFFETPEVTPPATQIFPQTLSLQPQTPSAGTPASVDPAVPYLLLPTQPADTAEALPESNTGLSTPFVVDESLPNAYEPQEAFVTSAAPQPAPQGINIAAPIRPAPPLDAANSDPAPASNAPKNEKAIANPATETHPSRDIPALNTAPSEDHINNSTSAVAEPDDRVAAAGASQAVAPWSIPAEPENLAEQPDQLVDIASLSEMAPHVVAQFLAAQPQPDASQAPVKSGDVSSKARKPDAESDRTSEPPDASLLTAENLAAQIVPVPALPLAPVEQDQVNSAPITEPAKSVPVETPPPNAADATDANASAQSGETHAKTPERVSGPDTALPGPNFSDIPAIVSSTDQTPVEPRKSEAAPAKPDAKDKGTAADPHAAAQLGDTPSLDERASHVTAQIPAGKAPNAGTSVSQPIATAAARSSDSVEFAKPGPNALTDKPILTDRPGADRVAAQLAQTPNPAASPASTGTADLPETVHGSAEDSGADSSDAASKPAVSAANSEPASRTPVSNPRPAAQATDSTSPDDGAEQPVAPAAPQASNPSAEAAANAAARPMPVASVSITTSAAPAEAVAPDLQTRPAIAPRTARGPVRTASGENSDAAGTTNAANTMQPDAVPTLDKSAPVHLTELVQDRDTSKAVSKPEPAHDSDSTPAPDAVKAHEPADSTQAVDPVQPQPAKADVPAPPVAPHNQPASIDIATPNTGNTHSFEIPLAHAGASREQDVPVRLAFSAPNTPDRAAFDALALKIASHSSDGESHFSIRLDPAELGKIEVNLNVDAHGHAQAELSADKPQTLELLQKDASALERALKDAGLNLSGGLAFSLKGDGRSQAWRDSQGGRGRGLQIGAADAATANAALSARATLAAQAYGLPTSHLDIRV